MSPTHVYEGEGDQLMADASAVQKIVVLPDALASKLPEGKPRIRLQWGQHLLSDIIEGRYRTLVCSVNAQDNQRGIIAQVAQLLPTSQWDHQAITAQARRFVHEKMVTVVKFDMDVVEVLGLLRPSSRPALSMDDLVQGFRIVAEMIHRRPNRWPSASVSFLGGRINRLLDEQGGEPSFEVVLRTMYDAGYYGDVYPAPDLWEAHAGVYARYPFPPSVQTMREGGF